MDSLFSQIVNPAVVRKSTPPQTGPPKPLYTRSRGEIGIYGVILMTPETRLRGVSKGPLPTTQIVGGPA